MKGKPKAYPDFFEEIELRKTYVESMRQQHPNIRVGNCCRGSTIETDISIVFSISSSFHISN
ncbi:MAG TPA: hypothetical protein DD381_09415 [Lentisphaeria bacterium]|nr:MAG: hypothetical protein A2X47_11410 [Lentisphaerae bacterium GWF2_38_69]HBM16542.1 hypothetical protein [Lentisphaeria bacterium]